MYRPGESVLEEKEESTNDSLDELVEVELPDAEDVLDAAFESNEFLEHAVDFLPLAYCTDLAADMPTSMDTIGIAEQIAYFGSTEIIEATEVAPDTSYELRNARIEKKNSPSRACQLRLQPRERQRRQSSTLSLV